MSAILVRTGTGGLGALPFRVLISALRASISSSLSSGSGVLTLGAVVFEGSGVVAT